MMVVRQVIRMYKVTTHVRDNKQENKAISLYHTRRAYDNILLQISHKSYINKRNMIFRLPLV